MRKIILIVILLLSILITTIFAQPRLGREDEIVQKLDQILQNQAQMLDYLKFIKNRSK